MLNNHDRDRLEIIYPDGIPEHIVSMAEKVQRRRHSNNIGTGPFESETLLLTTFIAEQQERIEKLEAIISERAVLKKEKDPEQPQPEEPKAETDSRPEMPDIPRKKNGDINWNRMKPGTRVMCKTGQGEKLGRFHVAMNGVQKGKLKIQLDGSELEYDVFKEEDVEVIPEI